MQFTEAFVVCPLSHPKSQVRARSDSLVQHVIQPVLSGQFQCAVVRSDFFSDHPEFMENIHKRISRADLIVADLTDLNPNVMYELGLCHMMGLPTVLFIDSISRLPSDVQHIKAITYSEESLRNPAERSRLIADLQNHVLGLKGYVPRSLPSEAIPRLIKRLNLTTVEEVHTGQRDHYKMASSLISRGPKRALLMQRSSTLVLGPEAEWGDEEAFYEALWAAVLESALDLYHIVSREGIQRHLARPQSQFPNLDKAQQRLVKTDKNCVGIPCGKDKKTARLIKVIQENNPDVDLKPDRQARVLIVEFDEESYEAIMVMDVGGRQISVRIRGGEAKALFYTCMDFYTSCRALQWDDMECDTKKQ